mgnify:CR=1 FL=1
MSIRYTKSPVPSNPEDLASYLQTELDKISAVIELAVTLISEF